MARVFTARRRIAAWNRAESIRRLAPIFVSLALAALAAAKITYAEYHGGISTKDRETAVDAFQSGKARAFVGHPAAAGVGLTLTAAQTAIYFSNGFSLEQRIQSEDRCHRKGTRTNIVYIDLVAENTIDESIASALVKKINMASAIIGDLK